MLISRLRVQEAARFLNAARQCRPFSQTTSLRVELAYEVFGPAAAGKKSENGSPIIVMHGLFGSRKNNRSISKRLAQDLKRDVYVLDMRNHGQSPHDPVHTYEVMAQDIEEFMDTHSLRPATLIGHSMGAKTAMAVALKRPESVANLIPVDNAPLDAALSNDFGSYVRGMKKIEEAKVSRQKEADEMMQPYEQDLGIRQFLLGNLVRADGSTSGPLTFQFALKTLTGALNNMADFPYKDPGTTRYKGPTLVVRGTKSHYVADESLPLIGDFFPKFKLCDIDAGHWVISEKPNEFLVAVKEFLHDET